VAGCRGIACQNAIAPLSALGWAGAIPGVEVLITLSGWECRIESWFCCFEIVEVMGLMMSCPSASGL
jgi:hypothetical protein